MNILLRIRGNIGRVSFYLSFAGLRSTSPFLSNAGASPEVIRGGAVAIELDLILHLLRGATSNINSLLYIKGSVEFSTLAKWLQIHPR